MYSIDIFNQAGIPFSWLTIYVGLKLNFLTLDSISQYAVKCLTESHIINDNIAQLAYGVSTEAEAGALLEKILNQMHFPISEHSDEYKLEARKWRFCILSNIIKKAEDNEKLLESVAKVYATFDYPPDMDTFIYYMPSINESYNPKDHSLIENQEYLRINLLNFMDKEKKYILSK